MKETATAFFSGSDVLNKRAAMENPTCDADAKLLLKHKDVLAKILQYGVPEFKNLSMAEILSAIPTEAIRIEEVPVDSDYAKLDSEESPRINEKHIRFDVLFRDVVYNMMIDIEPQNTFAPGYSAVKRGMYYLSRMLSSQLMPSNKASYDALRKCYSIWLCFDTLDATDSEQVGEYRYRMQPVTGNNLKQSELGNQDVDLMELVIVRAGGSNRARETLNDFITALFRDTDDLAYYLTGSPFQSKIIEEAKHMCDMREVGFMLGEAKGEAKGIIRLGISYNLTKEEIVSKLMEFCKISEEEAEAFYSEFAV